jgi:hypothetical protein
LRIIRKRRGLTNSVPPQHERVSAQKEFGKSSAISVPITQTPKSVNLDYVLQGRGRFIQLIPIVDPNSKPPKIGKSPPNNPNIPREACRTEPQHIRLAVDRQVLVSAAPCTAGAAALLTTPAGVASESMTAGVATESMTADVAAESTTAGWRGAFWCVEVGVAGAGAGAGTGMKAALVGAEAVVAEDGKERICEDDAASGSMITALSLTDRAWCTS